MESKPLFSLGKQIVATPGALELLERNGQTSSEFIRRHHHLEQGESSDADHALNIESASNGTQITSPFKTKSDDDIWVITEGDRSVTTVLLPADY